MMEKVFFPKKYILKLNISAALCICNCESKHEQNILKLYEMVEYEIIMKSKFWA
jgi:hypothetical protein